MRYATVVVGLPASGKSHYILNLIKTSGTKVYDDVVFDIEKEVSDYIIVTHPDFCIPKVLDSVIYRLKKAGFMVEVIYFENNPQQCLENAKNRPDKKVDGYIKYLTTVYSPPSGSIEVWK